MPTRASVFLPPRAMHQPEIYTTLPVKCFLQLPRYAPKVQVLGRNVAGRSWQSQRAHHKTHNLQLEIYGDVILCASSCSFPSPKQNRNTERKRNFAFSIMENTQGPVSVLCFLFHHLLWPFFSLPARKSPWPVGPPPTTTKVKSRFRSWPSVGRTAACAR